MLNVTKIFCLIALLASIAVGLALASESELASVDSQCRGAGCAISTPMAKLPGEEIASFGPSSWRLLLAGAALLAVRVLAKKIAKPKSDESSPRVG